MATTLPSKSASPRASVRSSPFGPPSSTAATAAASDPMWSPEPWVPVATAPATLMCGNDARLDRAQPRSSIATATVP